MIVLDAIAGAVEQICSVCSFTVCCCNGLKARGPITLRMPQLVVEIERTVLRSDSGDKVP